MKFHGVCFTDGKVFGDYVGCGCCGDEREITKNGLIDYIQELKNALTESQKVLDASSDNNNADSR